MKTKIKIEKIETQIFDDSDGVELDYIGKFTDSVPEKAELNRGDAFRREGAGIREYKYFIPATTVGDERKGLEDLGYAHGVAEEMARATTKRMFERMEAYGNGWNFVGIRAVAQISVNGRNLTIVSRGLHGIESDSGREYLEEVAAEEVASLTAELLKFGFTKAQIKRIKVERQDD